MNILVALDSNYVRPLTVLLTSLMCSNPETHFDIYVAHSKLTPEDFNSIDNAVCKERCRIIPILVPKELLAGAPTAKRISVETYYRLVAVKYLPENIERILYIDPDIVVINRLDDFYNMNMSGNMFAGATHIGTFLHHFSVRRLQMPPDRVYINAGVLMMNLDEIRKSQDIEAMFRFIRKNSKKLYLADQDVVNSLYYDKTLYINPLLYNLDEMTLKHATSFGSDKKLDLDWVRKNTVIVHFNGKYKPWRTEPEYKGIMDVLYFEYENILNKKTQ